MKFRKLFLLGFLLLGACSKYEAITDNSHGASAPTATSQTGGIKPGALKTLNTKQPNDMPADEVAHLADAKSPCRVLRLACQDAGFVLSGATQGNRLIGDCMSKLITGQRATSSVTGKVAAAPAQSDITACAPHIHHGAKPTVGTRSKAIPTYRN